MIHEEADSAIVKVSGLSYSVPGRKILNNVELAVRKGESVAVTGPSGSGKSTLLTCLLGLLTPDSGSIFIEGCDLARMPARKRAALRRRKLGMIFQFGELLPELSPVENVALAGLLAGMSKGRSYGRAKTLLERLGVPATETPTGQLSGGERQRTAVARALIAGPGVLLADEPTGALDAGTRDDVADLLFALPRQRDCALIVVTHDPAVARRADRQLLLQPSGLTEVLSGAH
ncbi:ATP-binding cassette domain-containing protein [Actinomadura logoneensis]|uniref:ATP-binding cassette domain-containing protein n=1 Tax=Actinomadura logoneensis TaxID=2293572 RepID=A0A372JN77_9ACTN|nr:ATP-binding cassette domain-containing protein [Actinomadura logoneensis]RFU41214.1 ATP-binding cassette domain-containing protein [Actinomadura logoneensis]